MNPNPLFSLSTHRLQEIVERTREDAYHLVKEGYHAEGEETLRLYAAAVRVLALRRDPAYIPIKN